MIPQHVLVLWSIFCIVDVSCTITDNVLGTGERSPEVQKATLRLIGNGGRNQVRRTRPGLSAPPYAVPMEPVFKYSQRDPLYDTSKNITNDDTTRISSKADFDVEPTKNILKRLPFGTRGRRPHHPKPQQQHHHHHPPPQQHHYPYYPEPPEPIIEIIIKESNISLPAPTTTPPPPTTKEPIHVFYVKYKKNPNPTDHGDEIIYEEPVPALTPHATEIVEEQPNYGPTYAEVVATPAPPPSTTLRTIIRPDSEVYHGSGLKVTFGGPENHGANEEYGQSAPLPQVALPEEKSSIKSDEPTETSKHHYSKRQQGPYPQKELRQEAPAFQQQPEQIQYRGPLPLENPPVQISNHRFPGQAEQKYFNRQASRFSNVHQQNSPPLYQNGYQFQNGPQNAGPTFGAPTQATQHNDRSFVQPTQRLQHGNPYPTLTATQQFDPTGSPQLIPSLSTVTEQQIQEYQKHKEFLIQQSLKQQQQLQAFPGQVSSQVPSTVQTIQLKNNFQNNQQVANQQQREPLPHIHVEQSPIIDQSQLQQRNNPQVEAFNNQANSQNSKLQNQYKFEDKIFSDSNYGQRLREKNTYNNDKRLEQSKTGKQPFYVPQDQTNFNQGVARHRPTYENFQSKVEEKNSDPEIIKSIAPIEDIQVQPTSKINSNEPVNPTVSTQNYNYNQPTESIYRIRNYQQNNVKSQQNGLQPTAPTHTNVRYNVRNEEDIGKQPNFNEGQQSDNRYNFRNAQHSTAEPTLNRQSGEAERQSEKANKYLTVYSRPHNSQSRRPSTAAPARNENRIVQSTQAPTTESPKAEEQAPEETPGKSDSEEEEERKKANIAALPDEVPEDLREQLLSSGILGNADIQILDYDKVGDIPIESLPPEALENFYGAASDPVPSVVKPDSPDKTVEMRVVRYDPNTDEGISNKYFQENATKIEPVFLNDSKYKRYLPLKVSGAQFPIPDVPQLKDRIVNSVVVLAPVDYDFIKSQDDTEDSRRGRVIQIQGVKFVVGDSLMTVIKDPSQENYKKWLKNELAVPSEKQSVVLLVTKGPEDKGGKEEIFMYEIEKESVRKLRGELSSTFVELASSNSASEDLDRLGEGSPQDSQDTTSPPQDP